MNTLSFEDPELATDTELETIDTGDLVATSERQPWGFPELFVISQTALPALLYLPGTQSARLPIRISSYAISLIGLIWCYATNRRWPWPHPARRWLVLAMAYLGLQIFNQDTVSWTAGFAHVLLYVSVIAPLFWASAFVQTPERVERLLWILLVCNGINATVGVLQVYDPPRWMPAEFSRIVVESEYGIRPLMYTTAQGHDIVRPPGLFDNPGAVAGPAMSAALLGLILLVNKVAWWKRFAGLAFSFLAIAAIYLSQVRTSLVIAAGMLAVYCLTLLLQRRPAAAMVFGSATAGVLMTAFSFSVVLGGLSVSERFATLFEADPVQLYYTTDRGTQLQYAFTNLVHDFPWGAGLGRWGMINNYFGGGGGFNSTAIWAELQPNAWIIDGGIVLLLLYPLGLLATARYELSCALATESERARALTSAIFAANAGTLALIFGFTPFTTQLGLQYWFLAGLLHGMSAGEESWEE